MTFGAVLKQMHMPKDFIKRFNSEDLKLELSSDGALRISVLLVQIKELM